MKKSALIFAIIALSACKLQQAAQNEQSSLDAYKACLAQHPSHINSCDGAKAIYEADKENHDRLLHNLASIGQSPNSGSSSAMNCTTMAMGSGMATTTCQ